MSALGKRKARTETSEYDGEVSQADETPRGSTLFVSNLPYTATSTDLQTLFSDFAPVRSAFVVTEHGTGISKGVGYVSFAAREDAQSVWQQAQADGMKMNGRGIRVAWAQKKPEHTSKETADEPTQKVKRPKQQAAPTAYDPLAIRTVILSGLPADVTKQVLWKKIRKLSGAEDVELEESGSAKALFHTPADALSAVSKLHAHIYKGALLSAALKKRLDNLPGSSKIVAADAKASGKTKAPSRASRLIVRNLPWDVEDQDLRALFLPYGPIHSIDIPVSAPDESTPDAKPRARGFAFVWMLSKPDAERALEGLNGSKVRAGLAARLAKEKQKKKKEARLERRAEEGAVDGEEIEAKERVIAVDWALSKNRWEEEKGRLEQEAEDEAAEDSNAESDDASSESGEESDHHGVDDETDGSVDDDDSGDEDERSDNEAPAKPQLPQTDVGTTLFIRNVPYEATEDDLRQLFRTFGPLRYARITLDPETGRGRGTAFACFWNKEDADKAIDFSDTLKSDIGLPNSTHKEMKKNPFKMPSLLTPDPSSSAVQTLVLHGRTLDLTRAVTRDEAGRLREQGERAREKKDKRNLYLLREGVISANSPAAQFLPEVEVQKRMQSFDARRALLKSNPSLYVSKTRLSIRRLPLFVSEKAMRKLATHAMRTFEAEVKAGTRDGLHADELAVDEDAVTVNAEDRADKPRPKKPFKERRGAIKQAKIVRQMERTDGLIGLARSKGYGFLETRTHADALRVLRWANNNPAALAFVESAWKEELEELVKTLEKDKGEESMSRRKRAKEALDALETAKKKAGTLIVEFSIENVQVVQRRRAKQGEAKEAKDKKPMGRLPRLTDQRRSENATGVDVDDKAARNDRRKRAKTTHTVDLEVSEKEGDKAVKSPLGSMIGRKRKQRKMNRV